LGGGDLIRGARLDGAGTSSIEESLVVAQASNVSNALAGGGGDGGGRASQGTRGGSLGVDSDGENGEDGNDVEGNHYEFFSLFKDVERGGRTTR